MSRVADKAKILKSQQLAGRFIHWAWRESWRARPYTRFILYMHSLQSSDNECYRCDNQHVMSVGQENRESPTGFWPMSPTTHLLRPRPHESGYLWIRKFLFACLNIFKTTCDVFKSNFAVHSLRYPDSLSVRWLIFKAISSSCENFLADLLQ